MRIHQILDGVSIIITNEELDFINKHDDDISVSILDPHNKVVANNLVRKGVYSISTDRKYLTKRNQNDN
jgi:uncharacterized protein (DUF39 family)